MSHIISTWCATDEDELRYSKRPVLRREADDWSVPVSFPYSEPGSDSGAFPKSAYTEAEFIPVMPNVRIGGQPELMAMTLEGFHIDFSEGRLDPNSAVSSEERVANGSTSLEKPWNQELLGSQTVSLYRAILTHDLSQSEHINPRGLYNTRNMCFFNSVLQVLFHCAPFNALLKNIMTHVPLSNTSTDTPVLNALIRMVYNYTQFEESRRAISGESFYDVICDQPQFHVERDRQEDSQEFLSDLLDVLETNFRHAPPTEEDKHDDLVRAKREAAAEAALAENGWKEVGHKNKAVETQHAGHQDLDNPIEELFGGRFKSVLVKQGARPSVTTEPFQQVPLDISKPGVNSVQNAFDEIFVEENLVLGSTPATKRLELDLLPPILIVHLKRFTFIRHGDSFEFGKITKPIMIDEVLKLNCNGQGVVSYAPIGVIYHHGMSATRGHYTADVKVRDQWYSIDDEQVVSVQGSEVLGRDISEGGSRSAYMIFYERKKLSM